MPICKAKCPPKKLNTVERPIHAHETANGTMKANISLCRSTFAAGLEGRKACLSMPYFQGDGTHSRALHRPTPRGLTRGVPPRKIRVLPKNY